LDPNQVRYQAALITDIVKQLVRSTGADNTESPTVRQTFFSLFFLFAYF